jgi:hypothetical protein
VRGTGCRCGCSPIGGPQREEVFRLFDFDRAIGTKSGLRPAVCGCSGIVSVGPSLSIAEPAAASLDLFDGIPAKVRPVAILDKEFLASVAEHGVLTPIAAVRRGDTVEVTDGSLSSSRVVVDPCGAAECCRGCDRTR